MSKRSLIILISAFVILSGVTALAYFSSRSRETTNQVVSQSSSLANSPDNNLNSIEGETANINSSEAGQGIYANFSDFDFQANQNKKIVLFFKASWCYTCSGLDSALQESQLPSDLAILIVDYDSQTELRRKYDVRIQHTLVQVDSNQNQLGKWTGSQDLSEIQAKLV